MVLAWAGIVAVTVDLTKKKKEEKKKDGLVLRSEINQTSNRTLVRTHSGSRDFYLQRT